ncbi:DNA/RNA nuclease SfsA [Falsigemmobacter faecalis]|uniref:Sugar fermentation stimulation protein homolog n=1 Tax=Falsigemmobacter faecalis TaxID=2488730 RepID=A0A3P3DYA3_9RHOB|nr:DNA/RNA nuclease SfsA [Falsigemmobacter faecalis]RRH78422.1 DNA/RNA nuclease SfsA [Falsigemmobacter faecalis]
MQFPRPLTEARLLRRYKRFLADVVLPGGEEVTVHCPNPGAMTGLAEPGMRVWLAPSRPGNKLARGWKLAELPQGGLAVIDTGLANGVVAEALSLGRIAGLPAFSSLRAEVRMDEESRIDFCLTTPEGPFWLEVKSVTLARQPGLAEFPDSRTARGAKHLAGLTAARRRGEGAAMLYLLARSDCDRIAIAGDIDPAYARAFEEARAAGVQMLGLGCEITPEGITPGHMVSVL